MRKPAITFETIFAAIAVLGAGAPACSKSERAVAEPPAATPAETAAATATAPTPGAAAAPVPAASAARGDDESAAIDAGKETAAPSIGKKKGASAACGATGCSAEMRKGGK